ncbi:MAG: winged helix-turn-helix domain-containing protein [Methanomicrobiales archaeon]|nr:winged helix-turn-helix domain-containing protein [Methanomicrobiales archaeon]
MAEDVLVLEPGDERVQKIARAISSQTASDILNQMKEGNYTATQIAEQLKMPLTTVQYHLENLVAAAMLNITDKKWSKKGREIKVYGLRNQVVIVANNPGDIRSLLLKYVSLFSVVVLAGVVMLALLMIFAGMGSFTAPLLEKGTAGEDARLNSVPVSTAPPENTYLPLLYFVLGGSAAIVTLAAYEFRKRRSLRPVSAPIPSRDQ